MHWYRNCETNNLNGKIIIIKKWKLHLIIQTPALLS